MSAIHVLAGLHSKTLRTRRFHVLQASSVQKKTCQPRFPASSKNAEEAGNRGWAFSLGPTPGLRHAERKEASSTGRENQPLGSMDRDIVAVPSRERITSTSRGKKRSAAAELLPASEISEAREAVAESRTEVKAVSASASFDCLRVGHEEERARPYTYGRSKHIRVSLEQTPRTRRVDERRQSPAWNSY